MTDGRAVAGLLAAAAVLAGCAKVDTSPIESDIPAASTPASPRQLPPAGEHWKGLQEKCPRLNSATARRLGAGGPGSPTDQYATSATVTNADCHWGASDGQGTTVSARISIWPRRDAADAQWQILSTGQSTRLRVGDDGFVADEADAVVVRTRSGNAVATVRLVASAGAATAQRLSDLRQAAPEITTDVLDDLVPG